MKKGASESGYRFSTRCARAGVRRSNRGGSGVSDGLIPLSARIEDAQELVADLQQAIVQPA
jgi:cystathionine beta-lyase/cystathionine gamma-synthase